MMKEKYTEKELEEIKKSAIWFKIKNFWRLPGLIRGHKVASRNPDSKVRNYSTVTTCFPLLSGKWVFMAYAHPLSIIHRILDGLAKWATEKYCIKIVSPKKWKEAFVANSFITVIPVDVQYVVAMPYIENENLSDILTGKVGKYSFSEKEAMILKAVRIINEMHSRGVVWGELVVANLVWVQDGEIIICDTETIYYRGSLIEQKASDWLDFICSVVGSVARLHPERIDYLVKSIVSRVQDDEIKNCLKERCSEKRTWLHKLLFLYTLARLYCLPKLYDHIKAEIAKM